MKVLPVVCTGPAHDASVTTNIAQQCRTLEAAIQTMLSWGFQVSTRGFGLDTPKNGLDPQGHPFF